MASHRQIQHRTSWIAGLILLFMGAGSLPLGVPVEIEAVFEIEQ